MKLIRHSRADVDTVRSPIWIGVGALFVSALVAAISEGGFSDNLLGKGKPPSAETAPKPAPPRDSTPVAPQTQEAASPTSSAKESHIRVPGGQAVGPFDIVGLRLGMTQEEAVNTVLARRRELNGKPITFEILKEGKHDVLLQGDVPRIRYVTLSDAKSVLQAFDLPDDPGLNATLSRDPKIQRFAAGGQFDVFGFHFPNVPNGLSVSGITRVQRLAPPVHPDTVKAALFQKYGPPTFDDKFGFTWLTDLEGRLVAPGAEDGMRCRGVQVSPASPIEQFEPALFSMKGCGYQLMVQLHGTLEAVLLIKTSLFHHQQLLDQREATQKAALSRMGLSPEQTKNVPAPQF